MLFTIVGILFDEKSAVQGEVDFKNTGKKIYSNSWYCEIKDNDKE
jgi:hypothetical protein